MYTEIELLHVTSDNSLNICMNIFKMISHMTTCNSMINAYRYEEVEH